MERLLVASLPVFFFNDEDDGAIPIFHVNLGHFLFSGFLIPFYDDEFNNFLIFRIPLLSISTLFLNFYFKVMNFVSFTNQFYFY